MSMCLCSINVKTAQPIRPTFSVGRRVARPQGRFFMLRFTKSYNQKLLIFVKF